VENTPAQWLYEEFTRRISDSLAGMMGVAPEIKLDEGPPVAAPRAAGEHCWLQSFSIADCTVWVVSSADVWKSMGKALLAAVGVEDDDTPTIKGTYVEIVTQAISGVGQSLSAKLQREVSCEPGGESADLPADLKGQALTIVLGEDAPPAKIWVGFSAPVYKLLLPQAPETVAVAVAPPPVYMKPPTMELLLDVELPVSVSFGRAQLPLKDVIKLTTGSIVELNRAVTEPVEIVVNNCVIARGEVVVVEGNFGVRITQVISRQERLRTVN
jgi:flagellar motor switch protein FliN